jgi:hypothetical protein
MVTRLLAIILTIFIISFRLRNPVYYFITSFYFRCTYIERSSFAEYGIYLLNRHVKHCEKLMSDTVAYEGFLILNHQVILPRMTAANSTYRTRHIDLYEQTLRMRSLRVLVVRKGINLTMSIFRSHKTLIYSFKKHFLLKFFLL